MSGTGENRAGVSDTMLALKDEVGALKSAVTDLIKESRRGCDPSLPQQLQDVYQQLIESQVAEEIAGQLVRRIRAELTENELGRPSAIRARLASYVEEMLPLAGPVRLVAASGPTVTAFVGPTGVGKTTTVAKLAANYRLRQSRKVGLITIDTYRIAAVDQLHTYARIINVPFEVVQTAEQMRSALATMEDCDVVLIDTTGRSPNDEIRLQELKSLLDRAKPHEVHLLLSSTASNAVLNRTIERFSILGVNRLIFTKLDEAVGFGVIVSCLQGAEARLSYVTTGQDVPDDIEVGRGARLAELIVSGHGAEALGRGCEAIPTGP